MKQKAMPAGRQGFTLIELLVGLVVFSLVIAIAINLFSSVLRSQRRSIAIQNVQDNGRYLMGFIAKEIRMSEIKSADGLSSTLDITHPVNGDIIYTFSGNQILRNNIPINSDQVRVEGRFFVDGKALAGDYEQPRTTIVIKVETVGAKPEQQAKINLQTTLIQRTLD